MRLVLDSSVIIDHLRGDDRARRLILDALTAGDELWSITATRVEIVGGLRSGEEAATYRLLALISWLDVTTDVADLAGRYAARFRRSHSGIDTVDYLVAAAVDVLGAELKTQNVRHFPMFEGLAPAYS
ncbi:MAG: PIN domain-containing protein [Candidatus Limnocylindrales bacterium]